MLLKPIIFTPARSIAPYRELVLTIGSPIVFHTAPPQPASNARITCPPVFVGGPDASQNGFGLLTPQNFTPSSAILYLRNTQSAPECYLYHSRTTPQAVIPNPAPGG